MNSEGGRPALILVVEDNQANQMLAEAVLQSRGYLVHLATSAAEALASIDWSAPISS